MLLKKKEEKLEAYANKKYTIEINDLENRKELNSNAFLNSNHAALLPYITEVAIQISNLCNYAMIHKKCPVSLEKQKKIMSTKQVHYIIDCLAENNWSGNLLCFHIYNEPLIDPRLFEFIKYAKTRLQNVKIEVYSNGYYLNQTMVNDLEDVGIDILIVTAYGKSEYVRLKSLNVNIPYNITVGNLDDRLDNYNEVNEDSKKYPPCRAFISQLCIYVTGEIGVCCLDYKHEYDLGNVFENGFECINEKKLIDLQMQLLTGNRELLICKNCGWNR